MIGILLPNFLPSDLNDEIIRNIPEDAVIFLLDNISPHHLKIKNPIFPLINVYDFIGDLWVFDLNCAKIALGILSPIKIHFFVWDLEWLRGKTDFIENNKIYRSVNYLYTREGHVEILKNYCNREVECKLQIL